VISNVKEALGSGGVERHHVSSLARRSVSLSSANHRASFVLVLSRSANHRASFVLVLYKTLIDSCSFSCAALPRRRMRNIRGPRTVCTLKAAASRGGP
jgi:hypothetical protein